MSPTPSEIPSIPESEMTPLIKMLLDIINSQHLKFEEQRKYYDEEIGKLKEQIARLEKNSSNSSKPPSSDITKPKEEQRQPGKRKIGGQLGHKGSWRKDFLPEEVDAVRQLEISNCPDCNTLLKKSKLIRIHRQAELIENPVRVTEYQLHGGECTCCKKVVYPSLPIEVIPNQLMGPRLTTLYGYMKAAMGVSISEIAEFSSEVLKFGISRGGVQKTIFRVSEALEPSYKALSKAIPEQKSLNIDETGWKENGKRRWVWLFCNNIIAYFVITKSRGCCVLNEVLGENFLGALTSDFYSAYVKYGSPKQQYCLAHLIREIKFLTTLPDPNSKQFGLKLLAYMRRLFKLWHGKKEFTQEEWDKKTKRFKSDLNRYLFSLKFSKKTHSNRIQRRLIKHWTAIFRFLEYPEIYEPTNNLAERTLRPIVRLRRISQGSRGVDGLNWTVRAASILATARIQKVSSWEVFLNLVNTKYCNTTKPCLLLQRI